MHWLQILLILISHVNEAQGVGQGLQRLADELTQFTDYFKSHKYSEVKDLLSTFWKKSAAKDGIFISQDDPGDAFRNRPAIGDGTEYDPNRSICGDLLECDITLTVEQAKQLIEDVDSSRSRKKRKVIRDSFYRWKSTTIAYSMGLSNSNAVSAIRAAIAHWQENTCLTFRQGSGTDYIYFVQGSGCYSNIGRTGGQQQISIGRGCERMGIAAHEIGHALGFWHEQSRSDRESYIRVNSNNIVSGAQGNFGKRTSRDSNNYNIAYDLGSVMHYSSKSFSSNNQNTISTLDPEAQNTIGQREGLSFIDAKLVNTVYCASSCRSLPCKHGGYADPGRAGANCAKCRCPTGFGGTFCEKADNSKGCGQDLAATKDWQTISGSRKCNYVISSGSGRIIIDVDSVSASCATTCSNYLEIKKSRNFEQTGTRYCCSPPRQDIISEGSEAVVIFNPGSRGSFRLRYRTDGSPGRPSPEQRPTTRRPSRVITRAPPPAGGSWSSWSSWTSCSSTCGMCGWKSRTRECSGSGCTAGSISQNFPCSSNPCTRGTSRRPTNKPSTCTHNVNLPCAWLQLLKSRFFDPQNFSDDNILSDLPDDFPGGRVTIVGDGDGNDSSEGNGIASHLRRIFGSRGKRDAPYRRNNRNRRPPPNNSRYRSSTSNRNNRTRSAPPSRSSRRNNNRVDDDSHEKYSSSHPRSSQSRSSRYSGSSWSNSRSTSGMCSKKVSYQCVRDEPQYDNNQFCCGDYSVSGGSCVSSRKSRTTA